MPVARVNPDVVRIFAQRQGDHAIKRDGVENIAR
jgi:hypothetical protein